MRPPAPPPLLANSLLVLVTLAFVFEMHRGNDLATAILGVAFFGVCVTWKGGSVWRR